MRQSARAEHSLWAWTVLLAVVLVGIDAMVPSDMNVAVIYVPLVLLSLWSRRSSYAYFLAAVATCLVLRGALLSSDASQVVGWSIINRLPAIAVVWTTAFLCIYRRLQTAAEAKARARRKQMLVRDGELCRIQETLEERNAELDATKEVAVYTLAKVAESRDPETGRHLERIQAFSLILANQLRQDSVYADMIDEKFVHDLYHASALHDIGKVGIRDEILLKPDRFTYEEFEVMKRHALIGTSILQDAIKRKKHAAFLEMAAVIAQCHHERFDGTGYPAGLSGTMIPLAARIVTVADVYDALTSERPYKEPYSPTEACKTIVEESGRQFDPIIVQAFEKRFEDIVRVQLRYPNNKYVRVFDVADALLAEINPSEREDAASGGAILPPIAAGPDLVVR